MKAPPLPLWRMPRARYDRLVEAGVFGPDDRVELLDGLLVAREPQGARHATVVVLGRAVLEKAFGRSYHVREEKPIALDEQSEPEPDIVVVPGWPRDYLDAHPSRAGPPPWRGITLIPPFSSSTAARTCSGSTIPLRRSAAWRSSSVIRSFRRFWYRMWPLWISSVGVASRSRRSGFERNVSSTTR